MRGDAQVAGDPQEIKVTYSSMQDTAGDLQRGAKMVREQIDAIIAAVKTVTGGWEGEAHEMMQAAEQQFRNRATHIESTLRDMANKVHEGSMDYRATDKKAAQLFQDI
ncbi:WXG100 family type VII secretion target [Streptomyces sp. RTd22]|uniref:WXG100 family type VII secretion target n=1 Tax=Streptomyces sp. RTd22 TaxID=1841249 RepID=UPI0022799A6D|nr:WXG100 family type VII secretion target [Streptomyces sp. RTd22]